MTSSTDLVGAPTTNAYLLPVSQRQEMERLELQQWVISKCYPARASQLFAPVDLHTSTVDEPIHILDVGCGTGAWSMELVKSSSPNTFFHLSDIKDNGFIVFHPEPPSNVDFSIFDVAGDWDSKAKTVDWMGKANLVHSRLLCLALTRQKWRKYLAGAHSALEPGGFLQIGEFDVAQCVPGLAHPRDARHELQDALQQLCDSLDMPGRTIVMELPDMLQEAGFIDIQKYDGSLQGGEELHKYADQPFENACTKWHHDTWEAIIGAVCKGGFTNEDRARAMLVDYDKGFAQGGDGYKLVFSNIVARVSVTSCETVLSEGG